MQLIIEKGIPIPKPVEKKPVSNSRVLRATLGGMAEGESVFVLYEDIPKVTLLNLTKSLKRTKGITVINKWYEDGVRIWRTSPTIR